MGSATIQVKISAAVDTATVSHSRSPITCATGSWYSMAMPKLPRAMSPTQRRYWMYTG